MGIAPSILEGEAGQWKLEINNIRQKSNAHRAATDEIKSAIQPTLPIGRGKHSIMAIGSNGIGELLRDLRIAAITSAQYRELEYKCKKYIR